MVRRYGWLGGMGEEGKETVRNGKEQKKRQETGIQVALN